MEINPNVTVEQSSTPQKENAVVPIALLLPAKENYAHAKKRDLVIAAVKHYQHQVIKDDKGRTWPRLSTEQDIANAIYEMTDDKISIAQSTVAKKLKEIRTRKFRLNDALYTIAKISGEYQIIEVDDLAEQVHEVITANGIFFNNPTGISTIFSIKADEESKPIVEKWLRQTIGRDLFKMFAEEDTLIALLRVDSQTYKTTSRNLKLALSGDGLKNTNHALRNFAKSWKP